MQLFVMHSFSGADDADAYRQAYNCEAMNDASIRRAARDVAQHPLVTAKLRQLQAKRDGQTTLAPLLSKQMIFDGITSIALKSDKDSTRLRAYELLGKTKLYNIFTDEAQPTDKPRSTDDVDRLLHEYLDKLQVIEGEARTVTSAKVDAASEGVGRGDRRRKPAR